MIKIRIFEENCEYATDWWINYRIDAISKYAIVKGSKPLLTPTEFFNQYSESAGFRRINDYIIFENTEDATAFMLKYS